MSRRLDKHLEKRLALLPARYQFRRVLGSGGMGAVVLAMDCELGRDVAIKLLVRMDLKILRDRFHREAKIMASIRHPNLIEVYDCQLEGDAPYMAMEYLEGLDLETDPGPDPEGAMCQAARGLQALHDHQVLHRDVKPANIFRGADGRALLADLGLAAAEASHTLTNTGAILGTPHFLAPEIFRGQDTSRASDWYAWGMSLYWVVEGRYPYEEDTLRAMFAGATLPPVEFAVIDPGSALASVIRDCLSPDPEDRPADLEAILEGFRAPEPTAKFLAGPPVSDSVLPTTSPRRRWGLGLAFAVGLVGGAVWVSQDVAAPSVGTHRLEPSAEASFQAKDSDQDPDRVLAKALDEALDIEGLKAEYTRIGAAAYRRLPRHRERFVELAAHPVPPGGLEHLRAQDHTLRALDMLPLFEPVLAPAPAPMRDPDRLLDRVLGESVTEAYAMATRPVLERLLARGPEATSLLRRAAEIMEARVSANEAVGDGLLQKSSLRRILALQPLTEGQGLVSAAKALGYLSGGTKEIDQLFPVGVSRTRAYLVEASRFLNTNAVTEGELSQILHIATSAKYFLFGDIASAPRTLLFGAAASTLEAKIFQELMLVRLERAPRHPISAPPPKEIYSARGKRLEELLLELHERGWRALRREGEEALVRRWAESGNEEGLQKFLARFPQRTGEELSIRALRQLESHQLPVEQNDTGKPTPSP